MKKKLTLLFLVICFGILSGTLSVSAATYGDLTYTVSGGEVTITDCSTSATSVVIPAKIYGYPVTSIRKEAFYYCSSLTSITIPESVTSIGDSVFYGCSSLKSINVNKNNAYYSSKNGNLFDKNKTTLIQYAIGDTDTNYIIPNTVTSIGDSAFYGCSNLTSVTIPDSVTSIGEGAFEDCHSLASVTIGNGVTSIGFRAFYGCGLTSITIPER